MKELIFAVYGDFDDGCKVEKVVIIVSAFSKSEAIKKAKQHIEVQSDEFFTAKVVNLFSKPIVAEAYMNPEYMNLI